MNDLLQENMLSLDLLPLDLPPMELPDFTAPPKLSDGGEKYLVFSLGDAQFYGVPSAKVVEAVPTLAVTALPNAPAWLLGIANRRGEVISVVNFSAILQQNAATPAPKSRFIVLRSHVFGGGAAFAANKINEIVSVPKETIQLNRRADTPHVYGQAVYKSQPLNLIDTEKLLATLAV